MISRFDELSPLGQALGAALLFVVLALLLKVPTLRFDHDEPDEQVYLAVNRSEPAVSKATVYNTLNLFTECGLVREINVDGTRVYYDSTTRPHHHFFNVDTGELTDLPDDAVRFLEMPELPEGTEAAGLELVVKIRNRRD